MVSSKIGRDFDILRVGLYLYCRFLYDLEDLRGKNSVFELFLVQYGGVPDHFRYYMLGLS